MAQKNVKISRNLIVAFACIGILGLWTTAYFVLPNPVDWTISYRPATLAMLTGRSPYADLPFYNAPWTLLALIPLAILPYRLGVATLFVANLAAFLYIGLRFTRRPIPLLALLWSFPVIVCLLFGQIDSFILLGLFLPRPIGLILLLSKPQLGGAIALFWMVEAWRDGGWKKIAYLIAPVTGIFLISLAIFGLWPLNLNLSNLIGTEHNTSLWPGSLMIGLPLLVHAIRQRKQNFSLLAAPFFSPYVAPQSWSIALIGLIPYEIEMAAASLASWALFLYRVVG